MTTNTGATSPTLRKYDNTQSRSSGSGQTVASRTQVLGAAHIHCRGPAFTQKDDHKSQFFRDSPRIRPLVPEYD